MNFLKLCFFSLFLLTSSLFSSTEKVETTKTDVLIIGSGAGGLTAAIYLARGGIRPYVLEGATPGGAITQSNSVENWPGEVAISGTDLMEKIRKQALENHVHLAEEELVGVDFSSKPYKFYVRHAFDHAKKKEIIAEACIIATGSTPRMLQVPGEAKYQNRGVYTCAFCDGGLYRGKTVGIVGGGDSAVLEAIYLSSLAKEVHVFVRKEHFRGNEKARAQKLLEIPNVKIHYSTAVKEIRGSEVGVEEVLVMTKEGVEQVVPLAALFLAIGSTPNSQLFASALEVDSLGYIVLKNYFETSVSGVFAVGDVVDPVFKQAIAAAGDGAKAAIQVQSCLPPAEKEDREDFSRKYIDHTIEIASLQELEAIMMGSQIPLLLDFYASWCGPCRRLSPLIENTASELAGRVVICKVNVDVAEEVTNLYGIRSMPTIVEIDAKGKEISRKQGTEEIQTYIYELKRAK